MARRSNLRTLPRKRYKADRSTAPTLANNTVTSVAHVASPTTHVTVNFSGPVMYTSTLPPQSWTFKNQVPSAYFSKSPSSCVVIVAAAVIATDAYVIADNDPAIRTQAGGFITASAGLVQ